jgi:hypothetical protein
MKFGSPRAGQNFGETSILQVHGSALSPFISYFDSEVKAMAPLPTNIDVKCCGAQQQMRGQKMSWTKQNLVLMYREYRNIKIPVINAHTAVRAQCGESS